MPALRTIFHVDMDAFFVSVEELFDPTLQGKAVVVGGQRDERGVVSAASYEARKFGVHSAMPLRTAAKLCPQAIFVDGHPERYRECSEKVHQVLTSFSPLVEMASIDEAYLDMTGTERLHGPVLSAAHQLHQKMKAETQLNCSIGIGNLAAGRQSCLRQGQTARNSVGDSRAGGQVSRSARCARHSRRGRSYGKEPARAGNPASWRSVAIRRSISRRSLWKMGTGAGREGARGRCGRLVRSPTLAQHADAKSISHEHTYNEDTADLEKDRIDADAAFRDGGPAAARTAELMRGPFSLSCAIKISPPLLARIALPAATQLDTEIFDQVRSLFRKNWRAGREVRLLGVQASYFDGQASQGELIEGDRRQRWERALSAADHLRDKFGESSITLATGMKGGFRERTHENPAGLTGKLKTREPNR